MVSREGKKDYGQAASSSASSMREFSLYDHASHISVAKLAARNRFAPRSSVEWSETKAAAATEGVANTPPSSLPPPKTDRAGAVTAVAEVVASSSVRPPAPKRCASPTGWQSLPGGVAGAPRRLAPEVAATGHSDLFFFFFSDPELTD
jgi:hypothetical protein